MPIQSEQLRKACEYALASATALPNFICTERVKRYLSPNQKPDLITAELTIENTKSHYAGVAVNGKTKTRPGASEDDLFEEEAGSTGEFSMLFNLFDGTSRTEFSPPVDDRIGRLRVKRYDFRVRRENNVRWKWFFPGAAINPGYHGALFVETGSGKVSRLRIEVTASEVDPYTPVSAQTTTIDYGDVSISGAGSYRLPVRSERVSCIPLLQGCMRYLLSFDDFHKFGATTRILPLP
jgi:hypothetical protein